MLGMGQMSKSDGGGAGIRIESPFQRTGKQNRKGVTNSFR